MFAVLHAAFHRPKTQAYRVVEVVIGALIVISVLLLMLEPLTEDNEQAAWFLAKLDLGLLVIFSVEVLLRIASYWPPEMGVLNLELKDRVSAHFWGRLRLFTQPLFLVDVMTVMTLYPALRGLRALRLLRLLRTLKVFRYSNPFSGVLHALEENRLLFYFAFAVLGAGTLVGGMSIFLVERAANPGIETIDDGIWWALVTITTVGFGDITAVTPLGRIVAGALMIGGMFTLALFAGIVGHSLVHAVLGFRQEQIRMGGYVNHIVVCGYDRGTLPLLQRLRDELDLDETKVVVFHDGERPRDFPVDFLWIEGDSTRESELGKARLSHASAAVVVGDRSDTPQHADARTLLTIFTLRSYLARSDEAKQRRKPLHIVAEILDSENVVHARTAGADEVIETHQISFSMIAHAISQPGTADVMSHLVTLNRANVYVSEFSDLHDGPISFGALVAAAKAEQDVLVIGVQEKQSRRDRLNPPDAFMVRDGHRVIYLAERALAGDEPHVLDS